MKKLDILIVAIFVSCIANAQSPAILSFSPETGAVGTLITINGTDLSSPTSFIVGGKTAVIVSNTATVLVGMVMPGAATGKVSISTVNGTAISAGDFTVKATSFPSVQQGEKLVGTGYIDISEQGSSVSVSADGNTAIVGGINDNYIGAAWIFTRAGDQWTQQGEKLVGTDSSIYSIQGSSVSISADGNTAIVGGAQDNNNMGAAWIYTRSGDAWTQQGDKLIGSGVVGVAGFGSSVALSADGNTAIVGGFIDNIRLGASWVFVRSGGVWTQQGDKLVGTGAVGMYSDQGISVDLSADGNTAIVGGHSDNSIGAAWIFTRTGNTWTQQGEKIVGTATAFSTSFGFSVAISADGNTAVVGGPYDNNQLGAVWIFNRTGDTWSQQGNKIVGTGVPGTYIHQGYSVSISADGNTIIFGGPDANTLGVTWVYTRTGDVWTQQGNPLLGTGAVGNYLGQGFSVSISADANTAVIGGHHDNNLIGATWVFTSSVNTSVQSLIEDKDIIFYPNPANNSLTFECDLILPGAIISIYSLQGKLLFQQQFQTTNPILDLTKFPKGNYVIKISNSGEPIVKRLVIG